MICLITDKNKILGVMMSRDIEIESRWQIDSFEKLSDKQGFALYDSEELKGYENFTKMYGYKLIYNKEGFAINVVDANENPIPSEELQKLDINSFPELRNALYK